MIQETKIVYTVWEITRLIRKEIEPKFENVWISGELSNVKLYTSGHMFFVLKDEFAQINAVIFNFRELNLKFQLKDGLKIIVQGRISIYPKKGEYRVIVKAVEPLGKGALQLAYEQLKEKLSAEGLFDLQRKKPIPTFIQRVGIVTSIDGAAIKDIITTFQKMGTNFDILIFPTKVQGDEAKYEISFAIDFLNKNYPSLDVLLVGRGGGSVEDLWAFNEERVARAIARSKIPIISCVGHEVDYTIADFVADYRAPTPTAAAEFLAKRQTENRENLNDIAIKLYRGFERLHEFITFKLQRIVSSRVFTFPLVFVEQKTQQVNTLSTTLNRIATSYYNQYYDKVAILSDTTNRVFKNFIEKKYSDFKLLCEKLNALSPLNVLSRGYSIVWKEDGEKIVRSSEELKKDEFIKIKFHKGTAKAQVKETKP